MKRYLILICGILSYAVFFGVFLYSIAFIGNFLVPVSLDAEPFSAPGTAIAINLLLLGCFAVQHSLMARPFFKKWLTRWIPEPAERSCYVMASNLAMIMFFVFWQPIGPCIWEVTNTVAVAAIYGLFFAGWGVVFVSTCLLNHFELFGLRQVWLHFQGKPYTPLVFRKPAFYKFVRHPLYVGWLMVLWMAPVMSASHLLFAIGCTGYILVAIQLEERDLLRSLGVDYSRYRNEVPMLVPRLTSRSLPSDSGVHQV